MLPCGKRSQGLWASAPTGKRASKDKPFFLYLALTVPHANNERTRALQDGAEVPDYGRYADKNWTNPNKGQAAMITRMDEQIGALLAKLREMKLD